MDAMNQLPCLPAPEKCPSVSGNKRQLHQTAQVFSTYSRGCHLPWLLQCGPQWFYKMAGGKKRGVKELTDYYSPTVGGRIQAAVSRAAVSTGGTYTTSSSSQHTHLTGVLHTSSLSFGDRFLSFAVSDELL